MKIGFSGHRQISEKHIQSVISDLDSLLKELKPEICMSGMAIGFDTIAVEKCIELKIPFIAAVPFIGQEVLWPKENKEIYYKFLDFAEDVVIVSAGPYASWKLHKRNEYIVDNNDEMIVCYDGRSGGGTKNFINYCNKKRKSIRYINVK